jgi:hypothetical protein
MPARAGSRLAFDLLRHLDEDRSEDAILLAVPEARGAP